jgi:DNA-directed RNA polymerase specialized sigma24 family protein
MRKVREVLRLRHALGLSYREISEALRVGKTSVSQPPASIRMLNGPA